MIQDTIVMPVIDSTYMHAVSLIENRQYKQALSMLEESYGEDYNTAVCLMSLGYDSRAWMSCSNSRIPLTGTTCSLSSTAVWDGRKKP